MCSFFRFFSMKIDGRQRRIRSTHTQSEKEREKEELKATETQIPFTKTLKSNTRSFI